MKKQASLMSLKKSENYVCRICLDDENLAENLLIAPCKCAGTMKYIHVKCLRSWLDSKKSNRENHAVKTYCWRALECELCKVKFPFSIRLRDKKGKV